ncbi:ankyrin repeat domain-containing protein [Sphingomonas prati]|uniref:ankyrin repeat domain-containing protein n=1 Tax=Sphingomonas prati TaxID=1843237 RepID=UPI0018DFBCAD|nr:ankyrin repeat domain-containing protein [Sphingomonas prati]
MQQLKTFARAAAFWSLWVVCVLMILPTLLSVPGEATPAQLNLYVAVLFSVICYPVVLPVLTLIERFAVRRGAQAALVAVRVALWGSFLGVLTVLAMLGMAFHAHDVEQARPVVIRNDGVASALSGAVMRRDTTALDRLIAGGAGVDHLIQPYNQTPAMLAANHGYWSVTLFLLERGASPDRPDDLDNSIRSLADSRLPTPRSGADVVALARVRARLRVAGPPGKGATPPPAR